MDTVVAPFAGAWQGLKENWLQNLVNSDKGRTFEEWKRKRNNKRKQRNK